MIEKTVARFIPLLSGRNGAAILPRLLAPARDRFSEREELSHEFIDTGVLRLQPGGFGSAPRLL